MGSVVAFVTYLEASGSTLMKSKECIGSFFRSSKSRKKNQFNNRPKKDQMNLELPLTCQYGKTQENMVGKKGEFGADSERAESWETKPEKSYPPSHPLTSQINLSLFSARG